MKILAKLFSLGIFALPVTITSQIAIAGNYTFGQFSVSSVYNGKTQLPDFKGRDKNFSTYRTRIRNGLKNGPNFAGHFSVIQIGCGMLCSFAFIADNQTGQVFNFPRGGENNMEMQLLFRPDSRLLLAQWADYDADSCVLEYFKWDEKNAALIDKLRVGNRETCIQDINETIKNRMPPFAV